MEFSDKALEAARKFLRADQPLGYAETMEVLAEFRDDDDIRGAQLVLQTIIASGTSLVDLIRFASSHKAKSDQIGATLRWIRDGVFPKGKKASPLSISVDLNKIMDQLRSELK